MKVTKYLNPSLLDGVIGPTTSLETVSRVFEALFSFCFGTDVLGILAKQQVAHFSSTSNRFFDRELLGLCYLHVRNVCAIVVLRLTYHSS